MKVLRKIGIYLTTLILCCSAFGAFARSFDEIRKSGKIVIATEGAYPPYNFYQGSKLTGFEVELAEAMSKLWGLSIEWKTLSFEGLLTGLSQGKWDLVVAGHAITPERAEAVSFSAPHFCGGGQIVSKSADIKSQKDLVGKQIAVQTGTTNLDKAKKIPGVKEVKNFPKDTDARSALMAGRVDVWVTDPNSARAGIAANPKAGLHLGEMLFVEQNAAATMKGNTTVIEQFNQALNKLKANGTYSRLAKKYFVSEDAVACSKLPSS